MHKDDLNVNKSDLKILHNNNRRMCLASIVNSSFLLKMFETCQYSFELITS